MRRVEAPVELRGLTNEELLRDGLATPSEAAQFMGVSVDTIYRMRATGLPSVPVRGQIRIPWRGLKAYLAAGLQRTDRIAGKA